MSVAEAGGATPGMVLVLLMLGGGTIFGLGYAVAVMHRANDDYKKTKAGLPGMRKAYWGAWWASVKKGFWITAGFVFLVWWFVSESRHG